MFSGDIVVGSLLKLLKVDKTELLVDDNMCTGWCTFLAFVHLYTYNISPTHSFMNEAPELGSVPLSSCKSVILCVHASLNYTRK